MPGGADVHVEGLGWRPAGRRAPVFRGLDLAVPAGQRVLLAGPSGAGKSTLLRAMAGLLLTAGYGDLTGTVRVGSRPGRGGDRGDHAGRVALLGQDPLASLVAATAGRDVAFGLENFRVPRDEIWGRVRSALRAADFPYGVDHPTAALSGGEAQRLALAGSLALDSDVLLLDEPTSMLDPAGAEAVRAAVRRDTERRGTTTVVVEQHLEPWLDFAERLVVLGGDGSVVADGDPRSVLRDHGPALAAAGVWVPGAAPPRPLAVGAELVAPFAPVDGELVRAEDVRMDLPVRARTPRGRLTRGSMTAVDGVSTSLGTGRALAVTGPNGSGKSTLVSLLAGLARPTAGEVTASERLTGGHERRLWRWPSRDLAGRLSWVPQLPEHGVVATTVFDEVIAACRACGRPTEWAVRRTEHLLAALGLDCMRDQNPYHLSGGEQRRLMVAAALAHGPNVLLLDEPTVGQDRLTWAAVVGAVTAARSAGCGVAIASHDALAVATLADDRLELADGVATR